MQLRITICGIFFMNENYFNRTAPGEIKLPQEDGVRFTNSTLKSAMIRANKENYNGINNT